MMCGLFVRVFFQNATHLIWQNCAFKIFSKEIEVRQVNNNNFLVHGTDFFMHCLVMRVWVHMCELWHCNRTHHNWNVLSYNATPCNLVMIGKRLAYRLSRSHSIVSPFSSHVEYMLVQCMEWNHNCFNTLSSLDDLKESLCPGRVSHNLGKPTSRLMTKIKIWGLSAWKTAKGSQKQNPIETF